MKNKVVAPCQSCGQLSRIRTKGMCSACYLRDLDSRKPGTREKHLAYMRAWKRKHEPYNDVMPSEIEIVRRITSPRSVRVKGKLVEVQLTIGDWLAFITMGRARNKRMFEEVLQKPRSPHQRRSKCPQPSVA